MTPDISAVAFRNVSKRYDSLGSGSRFALERVSFDVPPGRRIAVVGRSGSGKSTLLNLAAGIDVPTDGSVLLDGHDLGALSEHSRTLLRRERIGLVFQFFYLLPHLTVRENVALPELIAGSRSEDFSSRVLELLGRVGLTDRVEDSIQRLSGGEMQRVAICRSLLRRPPLLLADEPTGNLDDATSRQVMDLLLSMADQGNSTVVYVTHSLELAALADETWQLHSGRLERP